MTMLRAGMKEVGREIEFYRGQPVQHGDRSASTFVVQFFLTVHPNTTEGRFLHLMFTFAARPSNTETGRLLHLLFSFAASLSNTETGRLLH